MNPIKNRRNEYMKRSDVSKAAARAKTHLRENTPKPKIRDIALMQIDENFYFSFAADKKKKP